MFLKRNKLPAWLLIVATLLCVLPVGLFAATVTASLDNDHLVLGENSTLSFEVEGGSAEREPSPPAVEGLRYESRGTSQQFSFVNGASSSKYIYTFAVVPQRVGDFTIPPVTLKVGGQILTTEPLKLTVTKAAAPSAEAINSGNQPMFLKLILPKKEFYAGECFVAGIDVYVRDGIGVQNFDPAPTAPDGFAFGKRGQGPQRRERVGNSVYTVFPVSIATTAVKSGQFDFGPVTSSCVIEIPVNRGDDFGFFRQVQTRQVSLATESFAVQIMPLPVENVPPDFTGAVGKYSLNVMAGPTNVIAGDPITLRVMVQGHGSFDTISLPSLTQDGWQNFKTYPPTAKVDATDSLGMEGTKTFEEIIVPQNADIHEVPPINFTYFDPETKGYKTLAQSPIPLVVKPGGSTVVPTIAANQNARDNTPPPTQDIVPIKQRPGSITSSGVALIDSNVFLATQSVPVLAFMGAFFWRRRRESLANNPKLRRKREVARIVQEGLATLQLRARENNSDEFFATVFHLLQERLGERLDVPATAITEAVVEERLRPAGVPEPLLQSLAELFQWCNLARYAPMRTSQELAAVIPKLETALKQAEEINL